MNPVDTTELLRARDLLLAGDVVAIPTETVYGLAASIDNEAGIRKIFSLKERPFFDPLIVHVPSFKQARTLVKNWPPLADFITRMFWPGPLTVVLPKADHVNPLITSGLETVAIRYPSHPLTLDLLHLVDVPLAAPSANKFGRTSPSRAEHVRTEFPNSQLLILDGGECQVGVESTVIAIDGADDANEIKILRPGAITTEMITEMLTKWSRPVTVKRETSEASPGHLKHHYMPKIPLVIVSNTEAKGLSEKTRNKIASELKTKVFNAAEIHLSEDATQAARELYSEMRRLAESGADALYVRAPANETDGLWTAIWDRLSRAASLNLSQK